MTGRRVFDAAHVSAPPGHDMRRADQLLDQTGRQPRRGNGRGEADRVVVPASDA